MVAPRPFEREKLTGNVRGVPRRLGKRLTMQVEVLVERAGAFDVLPCPPMPGCRDLDDWMRRDAQRVAAAWKPVATRWRDATWEDQLALLKTQNAELTGRPALR